MLKHHGGVEKLDTQYGASVYANTGTYRRKVIYGLLNDADLWRFFCLLIVFILLAFLKRLSPSAH